MNKGRIVIKINSPVLIQDPVLDSRDMVATIRDWTSGMPYIPAGVIIRALRQNADLIRGVSRDKGARVDKVLGFAEKEGMLWVGHAYFNGIGPAGLASTRNRQLFVRDIYDALTEDVSTWYGQKMVTGRAIAAGLVFESAFQWTGEATDADYDCLNACCAGIRLIGEKTGEGLGRVGVMPDEVELTKKNLEFLGG